MKYTKVFLFLRIYIYSSPRVHFSFILLLRHKDIVLHTGLQCRTHGDVLYSFSLSFGVFLYLLLLPLFCFPSSFFFFFNFHWFICWEVEEELFLPEKTSCTALVFAAFETVKFSLHPHFLLPLGVGTWQNIFVFQSESNYHKLLCLA